MKIGIPNLYDYASSHAQKMLAKVLKNLVSPLIAFTGLIITSKLSYPKSFQVMKLSG